MRTTQQLAYHEAAHAVAYLDCVICVLEVWIDSEGGHCAHAGEMDDVPDDAARFVALAGSYGTRLLGEYDDEPSFGDMSIFLGAGGATTQERRWLERRLGDWVADREAEITLLARELSARLRLSARDLGALVHDREELAGYRHLYAKPIPRPAPARSRGLRTVRRLGATGSTGLRAVIVERAFR